MQSIPFKILFSIFLSIFITSCAKKEVEKKNTININISKPQLDTINAFVKTTLKLHKIPGLSYSIISNSKSYHNYFGMANQTFRSLHCCGCTYRYLFYLGRIVYRRCLGQANVGRLVGMGCSAYLRIDSTVFIYRHFIFV